MTVLDLPMPFLIKNHIPKRPLSGRSYSGQSGCSKNRDQKVREKTSGGGDLGWRVKESNFIGRARSSVERFNDNGSIKEKSSIELKEHHLDEWSGIISPVDLARKIEEYEDVRKTFQKKVQCSYSKNTMKKKWNNPTIIPRKNVSMNNPINTREHKNRNNHQDFEKRRCPQCFECGSYDHFRPQCPKLKKYSSETINRLKRNSENASLDPYTIRGKVNGFEMPILRDTGTSIDIVFEKFITPNMFTGENVWVQHILDEHMTCLPLAEVEIDCEWGHVITKAAVVQKQLDQGRYILGNQTIELLESDLEHNSSPRREIENAIQTRSQWKKEAEQNRTSEADEKEEMKLEENLAADIENLLPSFTEEKAKMSLININTDES
ncbi:retrovirus-related Pol polyprotein from transposon 412 [Trichonephila clavipes]|nr:retrovirus-related Pol polyprotein from transposon 412 [Trichonephila clavipes]